MPLNFKTQPAPPVRGAEWQNRGLLVLTFLFLFVLPIPGTIAFRQLLLVGLLTLLIIYRRQIFARNNSTPGHGIYLPLLALTLLTLWLLIQAIGISDESRWALGEIGGQWLPALLALLAGLFLAHTTEMNDAAVHRVTTVIVIALLGQTIFSLLICLPDFLIEGAFPQGKTNWTAGKLEISYLNNLLLAFLAVDLIFRWLHRRSISALSTPILTGSIILVFVSNLAFGARNGVIGSILLVLSLSLMLLLREYKRIGATRVVVGIAVSTLLIGAISWASYRLDPRWQTFRETAQLAWDIDTHKAWLGSSQDSQPLLDNGSTVEGSAYLRIAWIRAGIRIIAEHPFGIGYGRNAFGHALRKTERSPLGHSHSGVIDLAIGGGIPALFLWFVFLSLLMYHGLHRYFSKNDPLGLILVFIVGGFCGRMFLDSINRDHMLIMFFMLSAYLLAAQADHQGSKDAND